MKKNNPLDDELFDEEMLYVIDGELMNKTIKVLQITGTMDTPPKDFRGLYKFLVKALKQISNNPTGEIRGKINDALEKDTESFISVYLYPADSTFKDSSIFLKKPFYVTSTLDSI